MPEARSRFVSAPVSLTLTPPGGSATVYDLLVAGGTSNGTDGRLPTLAYDKDGDSWAPLATTSLPTLSNAHVDAMIATDEGGTFTIVGGLGRLPTDSTGHTDVSTVSSESYASGSFSAATNMTTSRYAGWASDFGGTIIAGLGASRTNSGSPSFTYTDSVLSTNE
jgi:hypothetical protein